MLINAAFQTAVALAAFEGKKNFEDVPTLREEHLRQVVEMSGSFKRYIMQTHERLEQEDWNERITLDRGR